MHTVIETPTYLSDAKAAGLDAEEMVLIVATLAANPLAGDLIVGTGGARKLRVARKGKGKSGGYRVGSYHAAADVPVFLFALIDKSERANLSKAERNALQAVLADIAEDYRKGVESAVNRRTRR